MTRLYRPQAGNGLTVTERTVMDLWDAGRSVEQIAAATGASRYRVAQTVSTYDVNGPADRDREAEIRACSIRYAAALAATGRRYA